jgi:hypothetical protein
MTRKRDEVKVAEAVRLYGLGQDTRTIGAELGVDPRTVARWLPAELIRPRGQRPRIDPDAVRRARKGRKEPWPQVAADTSASATGVRSAYRRVYGDLGHVDHFTRLTPRQAAELRELWDQVPFGKGGRLSTSSAEGRRVRGVMAHYRKAGVRLSEIGEAIGMSGAGVTAILRDRYGWNKRADPDDIRHIAGSGGTGETS